MFRLPLSKDFGNANLDTGLSCAKAGDIAPTDSSHQTLVGEAGVRASRRFYRVTLLGRELINALGRTTYQSPLCPRWSSGSAPMLMSASPGRGGGAGTGAGRAQRATGSSATIANSAAPTVVLNVELSLPIFRLALAVFIPWRGADETYETATQHPFSV